MDDERHSVYNGSHFWWTQWLGVGRAVTVTKAVSHGRHVIKVATTVTFEKFLELGYHLIATRFRGNQRQ